MDFAPELERQVRLGKVEGDLRAITEECTRLKRRVGG